MRTPKTSSGPDRLVQAIDQRMIAAAKILLPEMTIDPLWSPGFATATFLPELLVNARETKSRPATWLILTAVMGRFPTVGEVRRILRALQLDPQEEVEGLLLSLAARTRNPRTVNLPMRIVTHPIVDVTTSGRSDYQSGIHRVVRETVSRWVRAHTIDLAIWDEAFTVFRTASAREHGRVTRFGSGLVAAAHEEPYLPELIVPWNTVVVLPDVPLGGPSEALASIAEDSGNRVTAVGYDLIPITSVETRPIHEASAAGEWLVPLKAADRVAGISSSATAEFAGFAQMLKAQGLTGPLVREVKLPASTAPPSFHAPERARRERPRFVFSGTREPHKNHRALLHAAERLWTEGLDFEVRMVGGNGWTDAHLRETIERLKRDGRALVDLGRVSEEVLWRELAGADAVVFASVHEGYGLPVVEALAVGTPVLTASYGSQAEVAADGGCIVVDPRDDSAIIEGLRKLVTDPELRDSLAEQARARPRTTWDDYAFALWDFLVAPFLEESANEKR